MLVVETCVANIGCLECTPRSHEGECDDLCRLLAEMIADSEGHRAWHLAQLCRRCGHTKKDSVVKSCELGNCRVWACSNCGREFGSDGPVGCPCDERKYSRRSRMHHLYRLRRRRW